MTQMLQLKIRETEMASTKIIRKYLSWCANHEVRLGVSPEYIQQAAEDHNLTIRDIDALFAARVFYNASIEHFISMLGPYVSADYVFQLYRIRELLHGSKRQNDDTLNFYYKYTIAIVLRFMQIFFPEWTGDELIAASQTMDEAANEICSYFELDYPHTAVRILCDAAEKYEINDVEAGKEILISDEISNNIEKILDQQDDERDG
ncbi:MAG: hypothetical protein COW93_01915 [Parcubacteria group bacterium CG22_combo_CG10-13_8_21_14_all_41_9]|nr:MAG: hypothetical protein COW93_01915 [Parcubacteria group bacterium CG22_combo_CG10-13_8_21_14_all_41_9]